MDHSQPPKGKGDLGMSWVGRCFCEHLSMGSQHTAFWKHPETRKRKLQVGTLRTEPGWSSLWNPKKLWLVHFSTLPGTLGTSSSGGLDIAEGMVGRDR